MFNQELQDRLTAGLGKYVVPIAMALPLHGQNLLRANYTTIMNNPRTAGLFFVCALPSFAIFLRHLFLAGQHVLRHWTSDCLLFLLLCAVSLLIPYPSEEGFLSEMHVFFSYLALIFLNVLLVRLPWPADSLHNLYWMILILAMSLCLFTGIINGLAEWLYASGASYTLAAYTKDLHQNSPQ